MAGRFTAGETKVRPGIYFRQENGGGLDLSGATNGVVAVAFQANWGPLGEVVTIEDPSEIPYKFGDDSGSGSNVAILTKIFQGGASVIKACRVGAGGTKAAITLKDTASTPANVVTLTAKYAGTRALSVTIKDSLSVSTERECIIYSGTKELSKVSFAKGDAGEVDALVEAINASEDFVCIAIGHRQITWYRSKEEAKRHISNDNECVIVKSFWEQKETKIVKPIEEKTEAISPAHRGPDCKYDRMLKDFLNSGQENALVTEYGGVSAESVLRGLRRYADLMNYPVDVIRRFGKIYLTRTEKQLAKEPQPSGGLRGVRVTYVPSMVQTV